MASGLLINDRTVRQVRQVENRLMDYTCTVKRQATSTGTNGYNQSKKDGAWNAHLVGQACKLGQQSITVNTGEQQSSISSMIVNRYTLSFPYGTDVVTTDHIYDLKDRDGRLVDPTIKYYEIKELITNRFKLSVAVEAIH